MWTWTSFSYFLSDIAMQPILSKVGKPTFVRHTAVPKRIAISQFQFKNIKWQWSYYIVYTFYQVQFSNLKDYELTNMKLLGRYSKNQHFTPDISETGVPIFAIFLRFGRLMCRYNTFDVYFAFAQGTLLLIQLVLGIL